MILGIAHSPGKIKQFCGQIHDLLKTWVLVQVAPSGLEEVKFETIASIVFSCLIEKGTATLNTMVILDTY